jgi:uncharacterized protein YPO0396
MILPDNVRTWPRYWRELYEERAAIKEYLGKLQKVYAEALAEKEIRQQAMNTKESIQ